VTSSASTTRAQRRRARRAEILEQALELLIEEGLDGFSTHRLAARLDLTAGALYRYFPSKDAILAEVQVAVIVSQHERLRAVWQDVARRAEREGLSTRQTALAVLVASAEAFIALCSLQPRRFRLLARIIAEPEPMIGDEAFFIVMAPAKALLDEVAGHFEHAADVGALNRRDEARDPVRRAVLLWGSLQGIAQMDKLSRHGMDVFSRRPLAGELIRTLFTGWGANRKDFDAARKVAGSVDFERLLTDTRDPESASDVLDSSDVDQSEHRTDTERTQRELR